MSTNHLIPIKPEDLAIVSGGTTQANASPNDQLSLLLTQIQTSIQNLNKNNSNNGFSSTDMMLLMMVMMGSNNHSSFGYYSGGGGCYGGGLPLPPPIFGGGCGRKGW